MCYNEYVHSIVKYGHWSYLVENRLNQKCVKGKSYCVSAISSTHAVPGTNVMKLQFEKKLKLSWKPQDSTVNVAPGTSHLALPPA